MAVFDSFDVWQRKWLLVLEGNLRRTGRPRRIARLSIRIGREEEDGEEPERLEGAFYRQPGAWKGSW
jgi:hypothetical protein